MYTKHSGPEAREWLRTNQHPQALASNRFDTTEDALEFVQTLYRAGATKITIPEDRMDDDEDDMGGLYADALVVELEAGADLSQMLQIYNREAEHEGHDAIAQLPIKEGRWLFFWWD